MQGPVLVTHHGRPRLVVLSAEEFARLADDAGGGSNPATAAGEQVGELNRDTFIANMFEGFVSFDRNLRVRHLNAVAFASAGRDPQELIGASADSPEFGEQGAALAARLRRVLRTGEVVQFESRGVFNPHRHYENRAFPFQGGVALMFSQLTELLDLRRDAEMFRAQTQAVDALGVVSKLAVNAMGYIEEANDAFCDLVGFPRAQVRGARLVDFVAPPHRQDVAQTLNAVMHGRADTHVGAIEFLVRDQDHIAVRLSVVRQTHNDVCVGLAVACAPA